LGIGGAAAVFGHAGATSGGFGTVSNALALATANIAATPQPDKIRFASPAHAEALT
jgi:hypothetical protein